MLTSSCVNCSVIRTKLSFSITWIPLGPPGCCRAGLSGIMNMATVCIPHQARSAESSDRTGILSLCSQGVYWTACSAFSETVALKVREIVERFGRHGLYQVFPLIDKRLTSYERDPGNIMVRHAVSDKS